MTRQEEIHEIANAIDPSVGKEIDEDYNCADVYDFTIGFKCGAKWADEHPNLHNDEKYQTVKVSQLDELNGKAKLYDEVVNKLHELVKVSWDCFESQINFDKYITEHIIQICKENL